MGNFYQNLTVKGPNQAEIVPVLRRYGRSAFVSPTRDRLTAVYARRSEEAASPEELAAVATLLSEQFRCPALAVAIYDDDVLFMGLFENGQPIAQYNSAERKPVAANRLCQAFEIPHARFRVWAILSLPHRVPYLFETSRHRHLVRALGLPEWAVGTGYR